MPSVGLGTGVVVSMAMAHSGWGSRAWLGSIRRRTSWPSALETENQAALAPGPKR